MLIVRMSGAVNFQEVLLRMLLNSFVIVRFRFRL